MQCKKCNSFIPEGYLYCPVCGEEVIFVSDFEIKLEDNIDMSVIASTTELPDLTNELDSRYAITKDLSEEDIRRTDISIDDVAIKKNNQGQNKNSGKSKKNKSNRRINIVKLVLFIFAVFAIIGLIGTVIGVSISRYYSYDYQYAKAGEYIADKDYDAAIKTCKHLIELDGDIKGKMLLADCYMAEHNFDAAIAVLYRTLDDYPGDVSVYDMIVKCYELEGNNKSISDLIVNSNDSTLALRYSDYVSLAPVPSIEPGKYVEPDPIKLSSIGDGTIYYTMDGSEPTENSLSYLGPIPLEPGENHINAIFINNKGIASEVISLDYEVDLNIPDNPVLLVNSGTINKPELIGVVKPDSDNISIYYCEGNLTPNDNSKKYNGPFLMPIGRSTYSFVSYNENGECSSVVVGNYNLVMDATIAESVAEYAISYQLISKGENVVANTYKTNYGYSDSLRTYYIIDEYSLNELTGRKFAVDVVTGELFSFITNPDGSYSTLPL